MLFIMLYFLYYACHYIISLYIIYKRYPMPTDLVVVWAL